jgi:hypothetical protein
MMLNFFWLHLGRLASRTGVSGMFVESSASSRTPTDHPGCERTVHFAGDMMGVKEMFSLLMRLGLRTWGCGTFLEV